MDERGIERAVLAGASMGAHTLLRFALEQPERAAALVVITPAYDPVDNDDPARLARWDALADGLRSGGVEGFVEAYGDPGVPEAWRETVLDGAAPAPERPRAPRGGGRRAARGAALAAVRHAARPGGASRRRRWSSADRDEADPGTR